MAGALSTVAVRRARALEKALLSQPPPGRAHETPH